MNVESKYYGPEKRAVPLEDKVDTANPKRRDGPVMPHNPLLTKMQNCVRYMQTHEMYLPPNPWPKAMFLFGLDKMGIMVCSFFMLTEQFDKISEEELFKLCHPGAMVLYFIPSTGAPNSEKQAQEWIQKWISGNTPESFTKQIQYLDANGWWVKKKLEAV